MPVKIARSTPRPSFGLRELLVASHISRLASRDAAKSLLSTLVSESSGECRFRGDRPRARTFFRRRRSQRRATRARAISGRFCNRSARMFFRGRERGARVGARVRAGPQIAPIRAISRNQTPAAGNDNFLSPGANGQRGGRAEQARIFTPVRESSGESRMSCLEPKEVVEESGFSSYIHGLQRQRDAYSDHIGFSRARLSIVSPSEPVVVTRTRQAKETQ
jgi:hypothetical protein